MKAVCILALLVSIAGTAAAAPSTASHEVERLIATLESSSCQFQRNGTWYPAKKAAEHLRRKHDYLRGRSQVASAEQFIDLAATRSSMSGQLYRVRCPGTPVTDSGSWLRARLQELRSAEPAGREPR